MASVFSTAQLIRPVICALAAHVTFATGTREGIRMRTDVTESYQPPTRMRGASSLLVTC